jgi:hypothetical protein
VPKGKGKIKIKKIKNEETPYSSLNSWVYFDGT